MNYGPTTGIASSKRNRAKLMTADQAARLKRLACDGFEPDAFKPNLTRDEAERRIAALSAKLKFLVEPPHTI
jgi:hypothetical protein